MLDRYEIEGAHMTRPGDNSLGRPVGFDVWLRPASPRLERDYLRWDGYTTVAVSDRTELLESFANLADQDDEQILRFAAKWGVLDICTHGVPATHLPERHLRLLGDDIAPCRRAGGHLDGEREPLAAWRNYATKAQAILNIAARLNQPVPKQAPAIMWLPLTDLDRPYVVAGMIGGDLTPELPTMVKSLASVEDQRMVLANVVQGWLDLADVRVTFDWNGSRPHFDLGEGSLFGALGLQLALAVARREGLAICDECGEFFIPKRQSAPGSVRRCSKKDCRDRAAKRESARRRRARERGQAV